MELILVQEFVQRGALLVVLLVFLLHDLYILDKANEKLLHASGLNAELFNFSDCTLELYLSEISLYHEVSLVSCEG